MRLLIVSDIHGSFYYAKKITDILEKEKPDKIILLGDLYYHGPRNPLPEEYNPMEVSNLLNSLKDKILAIKGNCDAEVDEMISEFKLNENIHTDINGFNIFFTHGHKYNIENLPDTKFNIMIYGHLHTGFIKKENGKIFANPGSISIPKDNTKNSYLILDDNEIILKDLNGAIITKESLKNN